MMKRTIPVILVLVLFLGVTVAPDADAGWLDKFKKDKKEETKVPPRYDLFPTMGFHTGVLGLDAFNAWTLDDLSLAFAPECKISSEIDPNGGLDEGRKAMVMGSKVGDTIVAWRVEILASEYGIKAHDPHIEFIPSESDPTVGVGSGPE